MWDLEECKKEDHLLSCRWADPEHPESPLSTLFPAQSFLFLVVTSAAIHLCLTYGKPDLKGRMRFIYIAAL